MRARASILAIAIGVALVASPAPAQNVVTLRSSARVEPGDPVRLAQLATIRGPDAEALQRVRVLESPRAHLSGGPGHAEIPVTRVRSAIASDGSVPLGRVLIRGRACVVGPRVEKRVPQPEAEAGVGSDRPAPAGPTVRAHVEALIRTLLGARDEELKLTWDEHDASLLSMSTIGRAVHVRRVGSSARMPIAVRLYEGERVVASGTVRVGVRVRRDVLVARSTIRRGESIGPTVVSRQEQWLESDVTPAPVDTTVGLVAAGTIEAGEVITRRATERPILVERGDIVEVHCISGSILIQDRARALDDGREGEAILFESVDGKRRRFAARVDTPGRAVMRVGSAQQQAGEQGATR